MATTRKYLFDNYNGKGFAAQYSKYSERAKKDVNGEELTLTVDSGRVTQVGGKPISAVPPADMTGATASTDGESGLVPAPDAGDQDKYLKGDGTWANVPVAVASTSGAGGTDGLMPATDKEKLDRITDYVVSAAVSGSTLTLTPKTGSAVVFTDTGEANVIESVKLGSDTLTPESKVVTIPLFNSTTNGAVTAPASANRNHYSFLDGMGDWSMMDEVSEADIDGMFLSVTIGGREYKVARIGNQLWTTENLDWKMDGITIGSSGTDPAACYYSNDEITYGINGLRYGLLYNYRAVDLMNRNANFPDGFRIPTANDWNTLSQTVQTAVKFNSKTGWPSGREGTDDFGFGSLPSGRLGYYGFEGLNDHASYFMYGEESGGIVRNFNVGSSGNLPYQSYEGNTYSYHYARSIRLVKDVT